MITASQRGMTRATTVDDADRSAARRRCTRRPSPTVRWASSNAPARAKPVTTAATTQHGRARRQPGAQDRPAGVPAELDPVSSATRSSLQGRGDAGRDGERTIPATLDGRGPRPARAELSSSPRGRQESRPTRPRQRVRRRSASMPRRPPGPGCGCGSTGARSSGWRSPCSARWRCSRSSATRRRCSPASASGCSSRSPSTRSSTSCSGGSRCAAGLAVVIVADRGVRRRRAARPGARPPRRRRGPQVLRAAARDGRRARRPAARRRLGARQRRRPEGAGLDQRPARAVHRRAGRRDRRARSSAASPAWPSSPCWRSRC